MLRKPACATTASGLRHGETRSNRCLNRAGRTSPGELSHLNHQSKPMFFIFLNFAYRSLETAALSDFPLYMPIPEDSPFPPESGEEYFAPGILSKLNEFQLRWLDTQSRELKKSSAEVFDNILSEWFVRHPATRNAEVFSAEIARIALDTFITSHHAEFLPVDFSK
jgi:hypothetical protein